MRDTRLPIVLAALLAAFSAACGDPVPDEPTWFADVQPLIIANCARCHGADPMQENIAGFRLDRYVAGDDGTLDAWDYREAIVRQAVDRQAPAMPLTLELTDRQKEILRRWLDAGAPKGDRDNHDPEAAVVAPDPAPTEVDQTLDLVLRAWDEDGDALAVAIGVRDTTTGETRLVASEFGAGMRTISVDTGQLASGRDFDVYAVVDDGFSDNPDDNQHEVMLLPALRVDHGARGTAPTVTLVAPNGGETLLGETTIAWTATDPDVGDEAALLIDLDLVEVAADGTETVIASIASGTANDGSEPWDPSGFSTDAAYRIRVTADDGQNVRSDESDLTFSIAPAGGTTDLTWADVKPIFVTYCKECHGQPARTAALEYFRLDKYDADDPESPTNGDLGVYEQRSLVYQRLVVAGSMPPAAQPQPSAADVAMVAEWILGGAPEGTGPSDAPPTFTWITPNDTSLTTATGGNVTLQWSASDPEGLPLTGGAISYKLLTGGNDTSTCSASLTGFTDLAVAFDTGSYAWTITTQGYYCLRGEATDEAGNTTVRIAARPVKYRTTPGP